MSTLFLLQRRAFVFVSKAIVTSCLFAGATAFAAEVKLAVAANFAAPMKEIAQAFESATGHKLLVTPGATGKFYAQIANGAPFEVFVAADDETPARLEKEGFGVPGTRFTYAIGQLALWSSVPAYVDGAGQVLKTGNFKYLAIANPKVAPYGKAAVQVMQNMGIHAQLEPRIVQGESIAQAHQFIATGNAQLGFVALSQITEEGRVKSGSAWIVPENMHDVLRQDAILLNPGKQSEAARSLLAFMKSEKAKKIIRSYGYKL